LGFEREKCPPINEQPGLEKEAEGRENQAGPFYE